MDTFVSIVNNSLVPFWSGNGANCTIDEPAKQLSSGASLVRTIRHKFLRVARDCVVPVQNPMAMSAANEIKYLVGYQTQNWYRFSKQMDHITAVPIPTARLFHRASPSLARSLSP